MSVEVEPMLNQADAPAAEAAEAPAEPRKKGSGRLGNLLKLGITVGVSAYVLWQAGLADSLRTLAGADWRWVALAAVSATVAMVINVKRWQVMLAGQGDDASLGTLTRLYLIASFFNNVLPSRFAGDVVRAYGASINVTSRTRSAVAVIMDRLIGAISVLLLGAFAVIVNPSVIPFQLSEVLFLGLAVGLLVVAVLTLRTPWHDKAHHLLALFERLPVVGKRLSGRVQTAARAVRAYAGRPGLLLWALLISMVANGISIVNIYWYAVAVGANVRLAEAAVVVPVVLAVGLLPISINGLGTIELTFVLLLGLLGVDPEVALAVAILRRLVLLGQSLVGGILYSARRFG
ncbi:MAG: lysylphosphatidylglycerol synthase transmembrane domain-containing protein [Chloroflexota bacterium]